jgi:hypothetical protein
MYAIRPPPPPKKKKIKELEITYLKNTQDFSFAGKNTE